MHIIVYETRPFLTAYKMHGCIRHTPILVGQIKKKKIQILNVMKLI